MRTFCTVALASLLLLATISLPAAAQTSTSPQAQTSPAQGSPSNQAQANQAPTQAPTNDELQLTEEQKQKIATVMNDEDKQIATVQNDSSLTTTQKMQKVQEIRRVTAPKVRAILTPEQLQKIAAFQEKKQREQNSQAPPPQR